QLLGNRNIVLSVAWMPRVTREDRRRHEDEARRDAIDYTIKVIDSDGTLKAASDQDEYFPLFYRYPTLPPTGVGLDFASERTRRRTLEFARDHNKIAVSTDLALSSVAGDQKGLFAALPVYRRGAPGVIRDELRQDLAGFVGAVVHLSAAVDRIISERP